MKLMKALEVLNPHKMPADLKSEPNYGNDSIKVLCEHYGAAKEVNGVTHSAYIGPDQLALEWKVFKTSLHSHRLSKKPLLDIYEELLVGGELTPQIQTLYEIKAVVPFNTAMCERGFSRMKLIKSALRNRLYIETLDALLTIGLVGPDYVTVDSEGFFEEVVKVWEDSAQRNPKQARFGNQNAKKRRGHESKTELPTQASVGGDPQTASFQIDELADADEEAAENVLHSEGDTLALVGPFRTPTGYLVLSPHDFGNQVGNNNLKGKKIAYKFETEWEIGTFKHMYRGRKDEYKGFATVSFGRGCSMYLNITTDNYGVDKEWVVIKKHV